jgi:hypothetical protein
MSENVAILAVAGGRKTECIVESAIAEKCGRVWILTYTNENQRHILRRLHQKHGGSPPHVEVMGWFSFLIDHCIKPYQRALTREPLFLKGLNFEGERSRYARKEEIHRYFFDRSAKIYRNGASDFATLLNEATNGAVIERLEGIYAAIYIDEVQDLVGYDLDLLEILFRSGIRIVVAGDIRQHTLATNTGSRHKQYRGPGFVEWLTTQSSDCRLEHRSENYRCNQAICDFANGLFPNLPASVSKDVDVTEHDGVFEISNGDVLTYVEQWSPVVLRHSKVTNTLDLPSINIGVAKGSTYDRVLIFPTKPMLTYLADRDSSKLKAPESLYVAVTRARHSVAFVVP